MDKQTTNTNNYYQADTLKAFAHRIYTFKMSEARLESRNYWLAAKQEANEIWLNYIDNDTINDRLTESIAFDHKCIDHELPRIHDQLDELDDKIFELRDEIEAFIDNCEHEFETWYATLETVRYSRQDWAKTLDLLASIRQTIDKAQELVYLINTSEVRE